jgi:2-polyprenyl-3-methyl-5-hydroxy-6-metoxy-1,4-benzoquinol methylase
MDDKTHRYYEAFAEELAARYEDVRSGIEALLPHAFSRGMRVLDVGAGSGRDMCSLLEMGIDVYGVEPSDQLRACAIEHHPALRGRLEAGHLPDLGQPFGGRFDGVLCSAVFMHVPREKVLDAALALRGVLKEHGRLLVSIPLGRPGLDTQNRDQHGRLFTPLDPDYLQMLFARLGLEMIGRWESEDALGRKGHDWCTLLFHLSHTATVRPIDEIADVLSRDRGIAT